MPDPVEIACAPAGGIHTPSTFPRLPTAAAHADETPRTASTCSHGPALGMTSDSRTGFTPAITHRVATPRISPASMAAKKDSDNGSAMRVHARDAWSAVRRVMAAH